MITFAMKLVRSRRLPKDPEKIDLRFLRHITLTDSYNGRMPCIGGTDYRAVLYGTRVAWERWKYRDDNNMSPGAEEAGNELYYQMWRVAERFLCIQKIARVKYVSNPIFTEEDRKSLGDDEYWDRVIVDRELDKVLAAHPQFRALVDETGVTMTLLENGRWYRVDVTKRDKAAA